MTLGRKRGSWPIERWQVVWAGIVVLLGSMAISARAQDVATPGTNESGLANAAGAQTLGEAQQASARESGIIHGKVIDQSGTAITGAAVKLTREGQTASEEVQTDEEGQFYFFGVAPGAFQVTVSSEGLVAQTASGTLKAGETYVVPQMTLTIVTQVTEVRVGLPVDQLAEVQMAAQEKQRVLGLIPNFYVSYVPDAAPLTPKQKFRLAWKSSTDPMTFVAVGVVAGANQAADRWGSFGQGATGYAKRYGASYADVVSGTFIGGAVLPSILKQDPRYFYKGKGSKKSRLLYALANSVICKGDNGRWQPNYSNIGGNLAAGGISTLYYPSEDRSEASLVFSTALIRLGETAVANILQEFLFPKLTPNLPRRAAEQP